MPENDEFKKLDNVKRGLLVCRTRNCKKSCNATYRRSQLYHFWLTRSGSGAVPSPKPQQASAAGIRDGRWLGDRISVAKLVSSKR
jgi:hypothetical protein